MFKLCTKRLSVPLLLALTACGPSDPGGGGGSGDSVDAGTLPGLPDASQAFADAASCGAQTAEIPLVEISDPPDLLIILDKSGSMNSPIITIPPSFPFVTKWDVMETAIENITTQYETNIRFGLSAFPEVDLCGISPGANVDIGLSNAGAINSYLGSTGPDGNTPAHLALQDALSVFSSVPSNPAGQYVLFATDGVPNCGGAGLDEESGTQTVAAVSALANQGIHTFVLGFGDVLGLDPGILNDAAQAGLEPQAGSTSYYEADDDASLEAALLEIAGGIVLPSCSFEVTQTPPDPDLVTVTIDGNAIPRDAAHNNGWDYHPDADTITFFGAACEAVQGGETSVSFVFGCPGPVID